MQNKIKLRLSFIALAMMTAQSYAEGLGDIPEITNQDAIEIRANPQTGNGMRSVTQQPTMPATMPAVEARRNTATRVQPNMAQRPQSTQMVQTVSQDELSDAEYNRIRDKAFKNEMRRSFPMTSEQIRQFNGKKDELVKSYRQSTMPIPNYVPARVTTDFSINAEMPVVMIGANNIYTTTLLFTDNTGAPWEILSWTIPNQEFKAAEPDNFNKNQLAIQTAAPYGVTSLTVVLKDAPAPISMQLVTGQPEAYSTFLVELNTTGPNAAKGTRFASVKTEFTNNEDLETLMTGVVPKGLKRLDLSGHNVGSDTFAWASRDGQFVYIRSPMTINAPAIIDGGRIGGTNDNIYQLKRTQFVSFAYKGRDITAKINGMPILTNTK